ncbi:MAG TPA: hypothetical protein VHR86_07695, partial [Armatimonadota bacterium]|nr:hypothetical protein [Armatimonadota bacterium]
TRNRAQNPLYREEVAALRGMLIRHFQEDGYTAPLDGDGWRHFPHAALPADPDACLLFQDGPGSTEVPAPGYERRNTLAGGDETLVR